MTMRPDDYLTIVAHYERCLERHGDSHRGVDWPNRDDALTRYRIMLEAIPRGLPEPVRLLDFGCGASHLYQHILDRKISGLEYSGLDLSQKFIALSKTKFPHITYYCADILQSPDDVPNFDVIVLNGVLTEKREMAYDQMLAYAKRLIKAVYRKANVVVAFNVMSAHVDWERDDLFHVPFDTLAGFLSGELKASFVFRRDYGLYEYTTYLFRKEVPWPGW